MKEWAPAFALRGVFDARSVEELVDVKQCLCRAVLDCGVLLF
jgi:hypothetical protein